MDCDVRITAVSEEIYCWMWQTYNMTFPRSLREALLEWNALLQFFHEWSIFELQKFGRKCCGSLFRRQIAPQHVLKVGFVINVAPIKIEDGEIFITMCLIELAQFIVTSKEFLAIVVVNALFTAEQSWKIRDAEWFREKWLKPYDVNSPRHFSGIKSPLFVSAHV